MTTWITVTPRLREGLVILDQINSGKLRLLASRVCQNLQSRIGANTFSQDEEEKLSISLNLSPTDLNLLLDTTTLIYIQAAYHIVKPAAMESYMKDTFNIQDEKINVLVQTWMAHAKGIVDTLRQKSIFPTQVTEINWNLNVQCSSTAVAKDMRTHGMLQLGITDISGKDSPTMLTIEADKTGLTELFDNLEKIQRQLDSLK
ncbi:COMM domain-containing protein 10-like [Athalia rosae]|uniref:COMM domain-containing protein 10-like n=1 Tax=Athalia rosae TaxID=37344 RepID=UPI002033D889|nr:COMM domain-containing protein 10-like [Athalia rosae]XP_048515278.1 COMM domain-containing protein 10-like [Athalia rosae]